MMRVPPGYRLIEKRGIRAIVKGDYLPLLEQKGLLSPGRIFEDLPPSPLKGRDSLLLVEGDAIVVRRNLHGGLIGRFLGDLFLDSTRPHRELFITWRLRTAGISTLDPIASITEKAGPFWRGYLITRYLARARDLVSFLEGGGSRGERLLVARRAGELLRRVHDMGILHADLQLKNFLVEDGKVYLIDFDRAREIIPLPLSLRFNNLFRLLRSVEKYRSKGLKISLREMVAFWIGYSRREIPFRKGLHKRLRFQPLRGTLWRLGWLIEGILNPNA